MSKVLSALGGALPDERPVLSLQIVESVAKCPAGYWPVSRTYDEDSDAGLLKQNGLFGKKPSHYICLSKSEGVPGYVMDGVMVVGEREPVPAGFSVAGRAGKRRLCTRVSRRTPSLPLLVTDVIVCSRMRQAPQGFKLAGEVNGKVVCYKMSGGSADSSPVHKINDYENVVSNVTPEANRSSVPMNLYKEFKMCFRGKDRLRAAPERPPKSSPLISELSNLSVKSPYAAAAEELETSHDYEALSPSYNVRVARPAPKPPVTHDRSHFGSPPAPKPRAAFPTLAATTPLEGVPFLLNPRLRGLPKDDYSQLPVIKRRTQFELEREYNYSFAVERQT